jgi:hypothetical protein
MRKPKIRGPSKHYVIEDSAGCQINGDFTDEELDKFKLQGWKVI